MNSIPYSKKKILSHNEDKRAKETSLEVKHLTKGMFLYMQSIPKRKEELYYITEILNKVTYCDW